MKKVLNPSLRPVDRVGLTLAAVMSLAALAVFTSALGVVTSVLIFKTNVISFDAARLAVAVVLPVVAAATVVLHRRLWA